MPGRFMEQDLAEVRERANLVEVISAHTQLRKAGPRTFKGLCPFHQEKTPSFTVDPAKQVYYCFGCGAGGDVFDFLRGAEGLSFAEAAERLATRLGITLRSEAGAAPAAGGGSWTPPRPLPPTSRDSSTLRPRRRSPAATSRPGASRRTTPGPGGSGT